MWESDILCTSPSSWALPHLERRPLIFGKEGYRERKERGVDGTSFSESTKVEENEKCLKIKRQSFFCSSSDKAKKLPQSLFQKR
jgi:hypothetical protein